MNTIKFQLTAAVFLALGTAATSSHAQTWAKTGTPGNLPATAQVTLGLGSLQEITGAFTYTTTGSERTTVNVSNPDLFEILIDGSSPFSATTLGQPSNLFDTQLFLFNAAGSAVYANDDAGEFSKASLIDPTVSPAAGLYYLGIATYGAVPRSGTGAAGDMFANTVDNTSGTVSFTDLQGPKAGVTGPLTNWFLSGSDVETGYYGIALTGASYAIPSAAAVPEASTAISFGLPVMLGLVILTVQGRRRARQASAPTA
ncbi:MAG: hypothetical protein ACRYFS_07665 [Janthinobacterium lividum]